jgi:hypothetical protein
MSGARVALISHGLWLRRFGGLRDAIGSGSTSTGPYEVIGVMRESFQFPLAPDTSLDPRAERASLH